MGAANETLALSCKDPAGNVAAVSIAVPFRKVPRNGCCDLFAECLMALCAMPTNADALSRLLITDRAPLLRWVARFVGAGPAAEDVAQSLWLRVQRVADDPPITHKRAYLYRLASNLALDHGKREARLQSVHEEAQALLWGSDQALAADRTILARDTLKRIEAGIEGLPLQTRRVFELHRYEHMTQRVVAEKLGISTTAVEKHMRRAMTVISACRDADD